MPDFERACSDAPRHRQQDHDSSRRLFLHTVVIAYHRLIQRISQTAQVAAQQGKYIGAKLHRLTMREESLTRNMIPHEAADEFVSKPFSYHHLGSLAYIGNAAVFDFGKYSFMGGLVSLFLSPTSPLPPFNYGPFDHSGPCMPGGLFTSASR